MPEKQRQARANKVVLPTQPYKQVAQVYREVTGALVRHGTVVTYDYKGRKLREERWHNGKLHGRWTDWHPNGSAIAFGEYVHGVKQGSWLELQSFDQVGRSLQVTSTAEFRDGVEYLCTSREQRGRYLSISVRSLGAADCHLCDEVWDATTNTLLDQVPRYLVHVSTPEEQISVPAEHGLARSWHRNGQLQEEVTFEKGRRIGPARGWYADGSKWYEGAFEAGLEHGRWTWWNTDGSVLRTAEFRQGRLLTRENEPLPSMPLPEMGKGEPRCVRELDKVTYLQFNQASLQDVVAHLTALHELHIVIDKLRLESAQIALEAPVTYALAPPRNPRGVTLRTQLQLLLEPLDLAPLVSHDTLIITTSASARRWRDPTGIGAIEANRTSRFAAFMRKPMNCALIETQLGGALQHLANLHGVTIRLAPEVSPELTDRLVTARDGNIPVAVGLWRIFAQHGLCCEEHGDELLVRRVKREAHGESR